jgi:regulator of sigma E protease
MTFVQTALAFLLALTLLIFVHELGHFLAARWCGVKVLKFSIGFGPAIWSRAFGTDRTEWVIAAIPLGGYVQMLDERDREASQPIASADLPRAFSQRPLHQRAFIVVAGPLANFLLAVILYAALALGGTEQPVPVLDTPPAATAAADAGLVAGDRIVSVDGSPLQSWNQLRLKIIDASLGGGTVSLTIDRGGQLRQQTLGTRGAMSSEVPDRDPLQVLGLALAPGEVLIGSLIAGEPAVEAGLRPGDRVLTVNGDPVRRARDLIEQVRESAGRALVVVVQRGADEITVRVIPSAQSAAGTDARPRGRIGAMLQDRVKTEVVQADPLDSVVQGVARTWEMSAFSLRMLGRMLTGDLSVRNLSGPVTIADMAGQTARSGLQSYLGFIALISVSLGVLNLLPIPVLDGGHLVYYVVEAIRRRPLSDQVMAITQKVGLLLVVFMMALALFNDFTRLIGP